MHTAIRRSRPCHGFVRSKVVRNGKTSRGRLSACRKPQMISCAWAIMHGIVLRMEADVSDLSPRR